MTDKFNNHKHLRDFRKNLRNNSTKSESMLWKALQKKQLDGRKFRRQHSLQNFIVDFYCPDEKLIIELDGQVHHNPVSQDYDFKRTIELKKLGLTVLRFDNNLVFEQMDMVLDAIRSQFNN